MTTVRFNAFLCKALSNTAVFSSGVFIPSRHFAKSKDKTDKKPTKNELKIQKLLKQYPDPLAPKRPATSYLLFASEYRKRNPGFNPQTMSSYMKQMGAEWRGLDDQKKAFYTGEYAKKKEEYRKEKGIYENNSGAQKWKQKVTKLSQEKPLTSGYHLFMQSQLAEVKKQNPKHPPHEVLSMAAAAWSELNANQKQLWSEKAKTAFEKWEKQLK